MAKLRVYELAKEFKLENKEIVRQLTNMGLDIRSHMSVLSREEIQFARERLKVFSRSEMVEEMRVTNNVIRRRRCSANIENIDDNDNQDKDKKIQDQSIKRSIINSESSSAILVELSSQKSKIQEPLLVIKDSIKKTNIFEEGIIDSQLTTSPCKKISETTNLVANLSDDSINLGSLSKTEVLPIDNITITSLPKKIEISSKTITRVKRFSDIPARIISRPSITPISSASDPQSLDNRNIRNDIRHDQHSRHVVSSTFPALIEVSLLDKGIEERRRRKNNKKILDNEFLATKVSNKRKEKLDKLDFYSETWNVRSKRKKIVATTKKYSNKANLIVSKSIKRRIKVGENIIVGELAKRIGIKVTELIRRLTEVGMIVSINQTLNMEEVILIANEFGFEIEKTSFEENNFLKHFIDQPENLVARPPVVTIMGHVDHGKTSLLDVIRRSNVVFTESGGITQHIGAYNVRLPNGNRIVFIDTPGHEAFTQMRARGAQITDVVVLVVAADDGVMQQTKEAINHSRAAMVPIVVAINKIDKVGVDLNRVRRELADLGLVADNWGGETIVVEISAKTGQGIDQLLDMLLLQSELLELKANPNKFARGRILEARLDKGRGAVATVIVLDGTLKLGDQFVSGIYAGKVRAVFDDFGYRIDEAGPGVPVEVQGFSGVPEAGDDFIVVESEKIARSIAIHRGFKKREVELNTQRHIGLEDFFDHMKEGLVKELKLVIKADVQGSVEALIEALSKLGNEQVKVNIIHAATGSITESDVMLASASLAIIIGFNIRPSFKVLEVAEIEHVIIRTYDVIYQVMDDITNSLIGLLAPVLQEEIIGRAKVRQTFNLPKIGTVSGCIVLTGRVERNCRARLLRDGVVVVVSKIFSLRRFKEDVKEVLQSFECGIGLENYNDIKIGDEIEVFVVNKIAAKL